MRYGNCLQTFVLQDVKDIAEHPQAQKYGGVDGVFSSGKKQMSKIFRHPTPTQSRQKNHQL